MEGLSKGQREHVGRMVMECHCGGDFEGLEMAL